MTSFTTSAVPLDVVDPTRLQTVRTDRERYRLAAPFPHAVFEDFFDPVDGTYAGMQRRLQDSRRVYQKSIVASCHS